MANYCAFSIPVQEISVQRGHMRVYDAEAFETDGKMRQNVCPRADVDKNKVKPDGNAPCPEYNLEVCNASYEEEYMCPTRRDRRKKLARWL
jgi:hypothetical protein